MNDVCSERPEDGAAAEEEEERWTDGGGVNLPATRRSQLHVSLFGSVTGGGGAIVVDWRSQDDDDVLFMVVSKVAFIVQLLATE